MPPCFSIFLLADKKETNMNNFFLKSIIIFALINSVAAFASQTTSQYFTGNLAVLNIVLTDGGNLTANIDSSSGALSAAFTPGFRMITNSRDPQSLTMTATVMTTTISVNSIFNIGSTKYIVLGNFSNRPTTSAVSDITGGSPSGENNANAIAYIINDPAVTSGLTSAYDAVNKRWNLTLTHRGTTTTSITVPSGTPLAETFDYNDQAGDYQAIITLTFL